MSFSKRAYDERIESEFELEQEKYVCRKCVSEPYLSSKIAEVCDEALQCGYCSENGASPLSFLCHLIEQAISIDYTNPAEVLYYDSREGGYQGETYDGNELIQEFLPSWTDRLELEIDVAQSFVSTLYCDKEPYRDSENEVLRLSWEEFVFSVKHKTRFLFFGGDVEALDERIHPSKILQKIGEYLLEFDLFVKKEKGTDFYRARVVEKSLNPSVAQELGSPPHEYAILPNRMTAAGISHFYSGFEESTAINETYVREEDDGSKKIVIAVFRNLRDFNFLDLTNLPTLPSEFDLESVGKRKALIFISELVDEFRKPIERDGKAHVEYVPTQVFTEFVQHKLPSIGGNKIDGILYRSSKDEKQIAAVVFADNSECQSSEENGDHQLLGLKEYYYLEDIS